MISWGSRTTCRDDRIFEIDISSHLSDIVDEFGETPTEVVTPARLDVFEFDFLNTLVNEERRKNSTAYHAK